MKRLIMHTDPDEGIILRLPDGWEIGTYFEPMIACLTIGVEGGDGIDIDLPIPFDFQVLHKPINLDGCTGCELAFFLDVGVNLDQATLSALLDPEIRKFFKIVLVSPDGLQRIDRRLYTELVTPEVAVMEKEDRPH